MSLIPWSFSSWSAYQTCPRQFYEMRVAKNFREPKSKQIIWGEEVHTALEDNIKESKPIPESMAHFSPVVERILEAPGDNYAELELACDVNLHPVGFWDDDAWVRGKGDLVKINGAKGIAFDWKTGKKKPNSLQLDLMSVLSFAKFPDLEELSTCFVWFQDPTRPTIKKYHRDRAPALLDQFMQGVDDMIWSQEHDVWPEKPSGLCRPNPRTGFAGCPVTTCPHNGRRK
ncbi:MAG TPA: PD-(D/E)XK nuclease family protein [Candidatus Acidoferrales bacterium]|nr:PD-(D/E)XK nuclease family protein [Candidatus Acidoferrales bacterium]